MGTLWEFKGVITAVLHYCFSYQYPALENKTQQQQKKEINSRLKKAKQIKV